MATQQATNNHVSAPIKRIRWATQRVTGSKGRSKRHSILDRLHKRTASAEKKRESGGTESVLESTTAETIDGSEEDNAEETKHRTIYFNLSLPAEAKDEQGHPKATYERNKVRTAKYTAMSFIPKNLWFQFHSIANLFFLLMIVLGVSQGTLFFHRCCLI